MIELVGVAKSYADVRALAETDLALDPGSTTVLIGSSGSGKSTLLRIILGLIEPDSGAVRVDGVELDRDNVLELRRRMGYVIQDGELFPHLDARGNAGLLAGYLGWEADRIEPRLAELCALTHLPADAVDRYPAQLSGGQRQRVSLMRALMLDPELLLLDEPLAALDPMIRSELQADLRDIFQQLKKTVVVVTHDIGEAAFFGDRVILLSEGAGRQLRRPRATSRRRVRNPLHQRATQSARRVRRALMVRTLAAFVLGFVCALPAQAEEFAVGSKKFTESVVLGELMSHLMRDAGAETAHRPELGGTQVLWKALLRGDIVRNTHAGLHDISDALLESAEALGLPSAARLRLIELPLASRSILAGIKTSAVINVGTATLGALIGAGGYGQPILTGIRLDDVGLILQGAIPAAALALLAQGGFELLERVVVPRGLRLARGA